MQLSRAPKIAAIALAALLATPLLGGCSADSGNAGSTGTDSSSATAGSTDSPADAASDGSESTDAGSADAEDAKDTASFTYNDYLDENGHWKDVTALDYVELCDYKGISVPKDEVAPTDDEVQAELDALAQQFTTTKEVTDRAVEDGDTVNIDYVGTIDGVEFDGGNTNGNGTDVTIGVTQYIDDFLEQLVGHKPGETFDVEVTFPETYGVEELNGKDAVFSVTINHISEKVVPEIDDEWVAANLAATYGWETRDELEADVTATLQANNVALYVQDYVVENSTVSEVPAVVADAQAGALISQYQAYADTYGMELAEMLSMVSGAETTDEFIEKNSESLDLTARSYLVYQAIAEDAGIDVTEDETLAYFQERMGVETLDELEQIYGMPYLKLCVLMQEVGDLLVDNAAVA